MEMQKASCSSIFGGSMIKNDRQYRITKARASDFEDALKMAKATVDSSNTLFNRVQCQAIQSQLEDLKNELREYEELRSGQGAPIEVRSFEEIPKALIKARIAAGLTQKQLAEKLGLKEQQIQRYEAGDYATASVERLLQITSALDVRVDTGMLIRTCSSPLDSLFEKLKNFGWDRKFVKNRLLPASLHAQLDHVRNLRTQADTLVAQVASSIARILGCEASTLQDSTIIEPESLAIAGVRFKAPKGMDERRANAYSFYAHYLGLLLLQATPELKTEPISADPEQLKRDIVQSEGPFTLAALLRFFWGHGIAILPLRDKGTFHAAYWRVSGRHLIVLKQRTAAEARWIIDVLHEVRHSLDRPDEETRSVIELPEGSVPDEDEFNDEEEATHFAGECALDGRAEELVHLAHQLSRQDLRRLKWAINEVAAEEGIDVGLLANYMAYRLSLQGVNWWGAATNLQPVGQQPWETAKDILLQHARFDLLSEFDRDLLQRALSGEAYE
jgi:transcriptional regulator with XRE-family HTH domain